jgi:hypothetical protein
MQAANRSLKKSEGLAKNVLFQFGDMSAHLQVHIMESPAYDILLGRPFEVLTKMVSPNQPDGECTITITDPNSGRKSSMVTWARGTYMPPTVEEVPDEDASPIKESTNKENSASSRTVFRAPRDFTGHFNKLRYEVNFVELEGGCVFGVYLGVYSILSS